MTVDDRFAALLGPVGMLEICAIIRVKARTTERLPVILSKQRTKTTFRPVTCPKMAFICLSTPYSGVPTQARAWRESLGADCDANGKHRRTSDSNTKHIRS